MAKNISYEQIIRIAAQEGAKAAQKHYDKLVKKNEKERKDNRLRNTKLLLKNYRTFKIHAENSIYRVEACEKSAYDILSLMSDRDFKRAESIVESVKNSAERTALMVSHIDAMVQAYRYICENSGKEEDMRKYRSMCAMYIDDVAKTVDEIASIECVDKRTVYRDVNLAAESMAALLFGVDIIRNGEELNEGVD